MTEETTTPMPPAPAVAAPTLVQKLTAECIGTFILIAFGVGSAVAAGASRGTGTTVTTIGLAFGIAIVVGIYAFGRISGGHFNPAVSLGAAIAGRISWLEAAYYAGAQLVGAIVGSFVLWLVVHGFKGADATAAMASGSNHFGDGGIAWWAALIIEIVLTAIFLTVILATTDTRNEHPGLAPLAIGLTLAAIHFASIPLTGTGVNPARSIGPALFGGSGPLKDIWLFIIAPLIGAAIAGAVYPLLWGRDKEPVPGSGWEFATAKPAAVPGWGAPDQFQQQWNQQDPWAQAQGPQVPQQPGVGAQGWGQPAEAAQPVPQPAPQDHPNEQTQVSSQSWQQPAAPAAEGELPVYEQDGWRWDYAKQQWVPIEDNSQTPPHA